jgi:hypothetical protein
VHLVFERKVTSNAATHALANQDRWFGRMSFSRVAQRFPMRRDKLWQWIGAFPALAHVGVIESFDITDLR